MAYLPLSTANLPDPAIDPAQGSSPEDYFDTVLYTGTQAAQSISDLLFQPDFVWNKSRSSAQQHVMFDVIRGVGDMLSSDRTNVGDGNAQMLTSFDDDGFSLGPDSTGNTSGVTYASWNWKAGGTGVSNTDGSINSTVSANTTSGFSIITYTGNGSTSNQTVGHGLGIAPSMIITKARETNSLNNWPTWHKALNANSLVYLNSTTGQVSETGWMPTLPSSSLIYLGTGSTSRELTNNSGVDYVSYVFADVDGFSKCGSYTGNGSTDGTFVYTGFRPAFVMIKHTTSGENWHIQDTTRGTYNVVPMRLSPNTSGAEESGTGAYVDMLSNGFKWRTSNSAHNASGATYIYMAFAENPFKYSNAR